MRFYLCVALLVGCLSFASANDPEGEPENENVDRDPEGKDVQRKVVDGCIVRVKSIQKAEMVIYSSFVEATKAAIKDVKNGATPEQAAKKQFGKLLKVVMRAYSLLEVSVQGKCDKTKVIIDTKQKIILKYIEKAQAEEKRILTQEASIEAEGGNGKVVYGININDAKLVAENIGAKAAQAANSAK